MKHLIFLSLALLMCANSATAAENPSGTCGTNCNWVLENGKLSITGGANGEVGTMDDYSVTDDGTTGNIPWWNYKGSITSVEISGVENIGVNALKMVGSVRDVSIGDSVTQIGSSAFYGTQISSVVVPDSVTDISWAAFLSSSLTSLTVPDTVEGLDGRVVGDWMNRVQIICKGGEESCENIRSQLKNYRYYDHQNLVWKVKDISDKVVLANELQCNGEKYYWNGQQCNRRNEEGNIDCAEGWYATNKDVCAKIKLRYTLPEADEATSNDNENMIEWIFE
ncbi:MAG: leucine-rich repeat domain-containing protein [Alphaproteobacteria bacterium]|nr:leucine-rich repeat domain-containing protein [Alphaproteobacteria bacterium]